MPYDPRLPKRVRFLSYLGDASRSASNLPRSILQFIRDNGGTVETDRLMQQGMRIAAEKNGKARPPTVAAMIRSQLSLRRIEAVAPDRLHLLDDQEIEPPRPAIHFHVLVAISTKPVSSDLMGMVSSVLGHAGFTIAKLEEISA